MKLSIVVQLIDVTLIPMHQVMWNKLPKNTILQETDGGFKNELYNSKVNSYKKRNLHPAHSDFARCTMCEHCLRLLVTGHIL